MTALLAKAGHGAGACPSGMGAALVVASGLAFLAFALWLAKR